MPLIGSAWETFSLQPDIDPATVAEVKAALHQAKQIENEGEKPAWYLGRVLMVLIPCFLVFWGSWGREEFDVILLKSKTINDIKSSHFHWLNVGQHLS